MTTVFDKPPVIVLPHPFTSADRAQSVDAFLPRETLGAYIARTSIAIPRGPVYVLHNGHRVPDALWRKLIPRTGDQIVIRRRSLGGGNNSKVISTVAMVALMVAAITVPGAGIAGLYSGFGLTGSALSLASAGIMLGGSLLITALLPPPKASTSPTYQQKYETSPTYSISGGRNRARQWEPMPLIMGRHKIVPDYGANYFTEAMGDDQYLCQVFHFGLQAGDVDLSEIKIGNTPIGNYQGVQVEVSGVDGKLSMFPGNVDTITGFALTSGVPVERTTGLDVTHIKVELAAQLFKVRDDAGIEARTVQTRVQYRPVGTGAWTDIGLLSDAIYATHYWALMVDYSYIDSSGGEGGSDVLIEGSYQIKMGSTSHGDHIEGDVEGEGKWRWTPHPHSLGQPWHGTAPDPVIGYSSTPGVRMTGARQEPTRQTVEWGVPRGQYEIRVWKETADIKDSRESNETAVSQILAFQADEADYTGQLRMAVRIKASGQLTGVIDELSAVATARCPVWTGSAWETKATSNPAWWYLWFARGKAVSGRRVYGAGLLDQQIDIDAIKAWAAWCDEKALTFNLVLDQKRSCADVLQTIARAGRASPTWQTGKLGVVWDAADLPVSAMFGPFNIKAGSFRVDYINDGTVDEIIGSFINPDRDWKLDPVRVKVPGALTSNNALTLDFEGKTNVDEAGREANLLAASQLWHRRRVSWETDIEGWVVGRGDVVQISHDLTVWGYSGRLIARSGNTITLDKDVPTGGSGILMLRDPEGNHKVVAVSAEVGNTNELTITTDMTGFALPGDPGFEDVVELDWAWFFDPMETPGRRFKITGVAPTADGVKFEAVDDAPEYYASEHNPYQYTPPRDGALLGGVVLAVVASESIADMASRSFAVQFNWVISTAAPVDVLVTVNGIARPSVRVTDRSYTVIAHKDDVVDVTVTPVTTSGRGRAKNHRHLVQGEIPTPVAPGAIALTVSGDKLQATWARSPDIWVTGYEVRDVDSGWGGAGHLFRGDALSCLIAPGDVGVTKTWYVRGFNDAGLYSVSSTASYTVAAPGNPSGVTATFEDTSLTAATVTLDWPAVEPVFGLDVYRVSYGAVAKETKATTITLPADWIGNRAFTVQAVDALGNASSGMVANIDKLLPAPPTGVRAQVIDNNVLLYWTLPDRTTLPVDHVLVKEGDDWATGVVVGSKKGSFTSLSELRPGQKRYWLATVDTDGWESAPVSIVASVSEPPDFVFRGEIQSVFDGTLTGGLRTDEGVLMPVDPTETWAEHFASRSWASPGDQVAAGYPVYIQPTTSLGVYTEVFDFETIVPSSRATATVDGQVFAGAPIVETTIETSADGVTWSAPVNGLETFATNFRFVRFRLRVVQVDQTAVYLLKGLSVTLSSKMKNDGGKVVCSELDADGTVANFAVTFVDVGSITLTPAGTAPRTAVYDFKDTVLSGTYSIVGGVATVNVSAHGLFVGQDVMLNFANHEPQRATVDTATSNSFTATVGGANKSGNLQIYWQSMRVYLFDGDGIRTSGAVSWAIKGN